jgi:hypothetical protein
MLAARRGRSSLRGVTPGNGQRRPPRPKIQVQAADASPEEAAAIAAALEQFLVEHAPAPESTDRPDPWLRAALEEGIAARQIEPGGWGPSVGRR